MRNTLLYFLFVFILASATVPLFAAAPTELPEAVARTEGTQIISPNGDGILETAEIGFSATLYVKSREGYIPEYGIRILDSTGAQVRAIVERNQSELNWFVKLFTQFQEFTLERSVGWDGKDDDGNVVADGEYAVEIRIVDAQNRNVDLSLDSFIVDTTPPSVSVVLQDPRVFSPNGDGSSDTYVVSLRDGSIETLWTGEILDSTGAVVRSFSWADAAPSTIVWDGTDANRDALSDGSYRFAVQSTDLGGNQFQYESDTFDILTIETPVSVMLEETHISPNGDDVLDTLTVALGAEVTDGITGWSLIIDDGAGTDYRTIRGDGDPPKSVVYDGLDDAGQPLSDGLYRARFSLSYLHGNRPFAVEQFVVDSTPPDIDVIVTRDLISPNGDGRNEETSIWFKSNERVTWTGEIVDVAGETVVRTDSSITTSLIRWAGTDATGAPVPDGAYSVMAVFTDVAGNVTTIGPERIEVDRTPPVVTFDLDRDYFSPDGDGIKDTLTASFTSTEPVRGLLELTDSAGRSVGTLGGLGWAAQFIDGSFSFVWNGISGSGLYVPDGTYTVTSVYEDRAGNRTSIDAKRFTIDTRDVRVSISAPQGFSPNGDGRNDTILISVSAGFYDSVDEWSISFVDGYGKTLREISGRDTLPREFTWDGSMQYVDPQIKTSEGIYYARLRGSYKKGNEIDVRSGNFFVDVTPPAVSLKAAADPFIQTDGAIEGDLFITLQIDDAHDVVDWAMDILGSGDEIIRSFTGEGDLQDRIIWKDDGRRISELPTTERVVIRVDVIDEVGNSTTFEQEVPLDILVVKRDNKLYLMVPNVIFDAYEFALDSRGAEQLQKNLRSINRVVEIFRKYPDYRLLLEGHALNVLLGEGEKAAKEEEILVPLTENRAKTVRDALVARGLDEARIDVEWYGGMQPIVDVLDRENRWKNRRVEFIMLPPNYENE